MEKSSFREILREKMDRDAGKNMGSKTTAQNTEDSRPERISEIFTPLTQVTFQRFTSVSQLKAYPLSKPNVSPRENVRKNIETPPIEKALAPRVKKADLDEISVAKWMLFEKTIASSMGKTLGEEASKSEILKIFRLYLKKNHPDATASGAPLSTKRMIDFALVVRIKDELLKALSL